MAEENKVLQNAKKRPGLPKGVTNNPNGRPAGVPNKVTLGFKQAVVNMLDFAAPKMVEWLDEIAQDDPAKALQLIDKIADYAFPRQNRTEHVGDGGGPVQLTTITRRIVDARVSD